MLTSQYHSIQGQTHHNSVTHCLTPGPLTSLSLTSYPMVQFFLQKVQYQQKLMHLMLLSQANKTINPPTELPRVKLYFPKWDPKAAFRVYRS